MVYSASCCRTAQCESLMHGWHFRADHVHRACGKSERRIATSQGIEIFNLLPVLSVPCQHIQVKSLVMILLNASIIWKPSQNCYHPLFLRQPSKTEFIGLQHQPMEAIPLKTSIVYSISFLRRMTTAVIQMAGFITFAEGNMAWINYCRTSKMSPGLTKAWLKPMTLLNWNWTVLLESLTTSRTSIKNNWIIFQDQCVFSKDIGSRNIALPGIAPKGNTKNKKSAGKADNSRWNLPRESLPKLTGHNEKLRQLKDWIPRTMNQRMKPINHQRHTARYQRSRLKATLLPKMV